MKFYDPLNIICINSCSDGTHILVSLQANYGNCQRHVLLGDDKTAKRRLPFGDLVNCACRIQASFFRQTNLRTNTLMELLFC